MENDDANSKDLMPYPDNAFILVLGPLTAGCSGSDPAIVAVANELSGFVNWNGNDAVGLAYQGVLIDAVGAAGSDPGEGWDVAGVADATTDHTLVRKSDILAGNADWTGVGLSEDDSEWVVTETDTFRYLGSHPNAMSRGVCQYDQDCASMLFCNDSGCCRNTETGSQLGGEPILRLLAPRHQNATQSVFLAIDRLSPHLHAEHDSHVLPPRSTSLPGP